MDLFGVFAFVPKLPILFTEVAFLWLFLRRYKSCCNFRWCC
uniref:Uncharacterized protein n=1 Tax=Arundo donax TaxID=35708 RepID=A0A0A8Z0T3_ARUDO